MFGHFCWPRFSKNSHALAQGALFTPCGSGAGIGKRNAFTKHLILEYASHARLFPYLTADNAEKIC